MDGKTDLIEIWKRNREQKRREIKEKILLWGVIPTVMTASLIGAVAGTALYIKRTTSNEETQRDETAVSYSAPVTIRLTGSHHKQKDFPIKQSHKTYATSSGITNKNPAKQTKQAKNETKAKRDTHKQPPSLELIIRTCSAEPKEALLHLLESEVKERSKGARNSFGEMYRHANKLYQISDKESLMRAELLYHYLQLHSKSFSVGDNMKIAVRRINAIAKIAAVLFTEDKNKNIYSALASCYQSLRRHAQIFYPHANLSIIAMPSP